jgi:LacI family transcriptional regulator
LTASIQRAFSDLGRTVFIANSEEDPARQDQFIATMREYNVDGLAICPSQGTQRQTLRRLKDLGIPCVLISRNVAGCGLDYAGHANQAGMQMATEHLIGLGHRRIAMVGGTDLISTGAERRAGYREALMRHGLAVDPDLVIEGPPTRSFGAATVKALLGGNNPPTAAVCFNDVVAFGVMLGLRQVGREPGRDFAVMGYDDLAEAELWTPALSTVAIDSVGIGAAAAQMLLERIENPDARPRRVVLQPKLMLRESSCPPRR